MHVVRIDYVGGCMYNPRRQRCYVPTIIHAEIANISKAGSFILNQEPKSNGSTNGAQPTSSQAVGSPSTRKLKKNITIPADRPMAASSFRQFFGSLKNFMAFHFSI